MKLKLIICMLLASFSFLSYDYDTAFAVDIEQMKLLRAEYIRRQQENFAKLEANLGIFIKTASSTQRGEKDKGIRILKSSEGKYSEVIDYDAVYKKLGDNPSESDITKAMANAKRSYFIEFRPMIMNDTGNTYTLEYSYSIDNKNQTKWETLQIENKGFGVAVQKVAVNSTKTREGTLHLRLMGKYLFEFPMNVTPLANNSSSTNRTTTSPTVSQSTIPNNETNLDYLETIKHNDILKDIEGVYFK